VTATAARPPADTGDARAELADLFLHGVGLEIGALHLPTALPPGSCARYVDRMSVPDLREHYPELAELELTPVDVIDDGERLETIPPGSVDFIVANHFLEHCQDPIATIETHLSKLRPGGTLFYAVPDKRYTFDFRRPRTPLQHLIDDHEQGPARSRTAHYLEWAQLVYSDEEPTDEQAGAAAARLEAEDYSIHFHVWTQADLAELMYHIQDRQGSFEIEAVRRRNIENIVVLRKHRDPAPEQGIADGARSSTMWSQLHVQARTAVPLAGLRARLDGGSAAAHWSLAPDGLLGRAWLLSARAPVTVPLMLDGPVKLQARAQLLPHDWRDSTGGVDAWVVANCADGRREPLWTAALTPAMDPDGLAIDCLLPADTLELRFGAAKRGPETSRSTALLAIVEPYLTDPRSEASASLGPPADSPPAPPTDGPLISVLCPVHDPPQYMLHEAIESIRSQTYANWELVLTDDGSRDPGIVAELDRYTAEDPRITLVRRPVAGGISVASNAALASATGEYVALLDHDDTLDQHALAYVARMLVADPGLDMVYTDEAVLEDGNLTARHLKPDWSPELIEVAMYTTHLGVYRRSLAVELGGFRSIFDGTQDYDFVLRLCEHTDRIAHVPEPLYHWRAHASSTAGGDQAKPYAYTAQPGAIREHLDRRGIDAEVQHGAAPGLHRIVHRVAPQTDVTLVVCVKDASALYEAALSWNAQPHPGWRVIVSAPSEELHGATHALHLAGIGDARIIGCRTNPAHSPVQALVAAAEHVRTEHMLLMQTPLLGLSHDWLRRLVGYSAQPRIAAVGPVVLSDDGRIAYAGVAIPAGLPLPLLHGLDGAAAPSAAANVVAIDGALVTDTQVYRELTGLDPGAGSLALVDYCLRAERDRGLRTVLVPDARMRMIGVDSTPNDLPRLWELGHRFRQTHAGDPYYNPQFYRDRGDFRSRTELTATAKATIL
jgi:SAM-dependent methyltransferase